MHFAAVNPGKRGSQPAAGLPWETVSKNKRHITCSLDSHAREIFGRVRPVGIGVQIGSAPSWLAGQRGRSPGHHQRYLECTYLAGYSIENAHAKEYLPMGKVDLLEVLLAALAGELPVLLRGQIEWPPASGGQADPAHTS